MSAGEVRFKRDYSKDQLKGRHHLTLTAELNAAFLAECDRARRVPSDLIRIILEDRYASEVHFPKRVEVEPHGHAPRGKAQVA